MSAPDALGVSESALRRFWKYADQRGEGECWPWTGTVLSNGYGQLSDGRYKRWLAHRLSYTIAFGDIPEGLTIDHVRARGCTRTDCVNPAHLEAVTMAENLARSGAVSSINRAKKTCPKGHEYNRIVKRSNGNGAFRQCVTCYNENQRTRKAAKKARRVA